MNFSKIISIIKKINVHVVFFVLIFLIIGIIALRLHSWNNSGQTVDLSDVNSSDFDREVLDYYTPYTYTGDPVNDQDEMVIAFFGNSPLADDAGTEDCLAEMIGEKTGATVYNFAVADSLMSCEDTTIDYENGDRDLFSLYWLTTIFTVDNDTLLSNARYYDSYSLEEIATLSMLVNLDFTEVDVIVIMYDLSDYLEGRRMYDYENTQDITKWACALEASLDLIQTYCPHIQIIVMSPTYGYALDEDGSYVDSSIMTYNDEGTLGSYVQYEADVCYSMFCSFVDNYYGTISVTEAEEYLLDYKHISVEGRQLLAERFMDAYEYYLKYQTQ
ncbi:MAG: hypothetical protein LUH58_11495 [Lachnospiraceae bacterium]|nr:hypothetical protein [Lachnospiraceae bacterium]